MSASAMTILANVQSAYVNDTFDHIPIAIDMQAGQIRGSA
jgi:hypothetical protein